MALFSNFFRRSRPSSQQVKQGTHRPGRQRAAWHRNPHAYVLVVDESGSTSERFRLSGTLTISRIEAVRRAGRNYLQQLAASHPGQLVGLIGFSNQASLYHTLQPVGRCFPSLDAALLRLHPQSATNISAGLSMALDQLASAQTKTRTIMLITDGAANVDEKRLPGLIRKAQVLGVRIHTIGVGNNADSDYDRQLLFDMARGTGGRFHSAHSFTTLCRALRRAA